MGRKLNKRFLRLTLEIANAMTARQFSGAEWSVAFAIITGTFGTFDATAKEARDRNEFPLVGLMKTTGLSKSAVLEALHDLRDDQVIIVHREPSSHRPGIYGIQDHPEKWLRPERSSVAESSPNSVVKRVPKKVRVSGPNSVVKRGPKRSQMTTEEGTQTSTVEPKKAPVDHVDLPSVVVDQPNLPSKRYDKVLRPISPIPVTREQREAVALSDYIRLADYTEGQKLEALAEGVTQTQAYIAGKKGITGPFVCWAISKASKFLATLVIEPEVDEAEQERQRANWEKHQEEIRNFRYPWENEEEAKALGLTYVPRESKTDTPLASYDWRGGARGGKEAQAGPDP